MLKNQNCIPNASGNNGFSTFFYMGISYKHFEVLRRKVQVDTKYRPLRSVQSKKKVSLSLNLYMHHNSLLVKFGHSADQTLLPQSDNKCSKILFIKWFCPYSLLSVLLIPLLSLRLIPERNSDSNLQERGLNKPM